MNLYESITKHLKEGATWGGASIEYILEDAKKYLEFICDEYIKDVKKYKQVDVNPYDMEELVLPTLKANFDNLASTFPDEELDQDAIEKVIAHLTRFKEHGIKTEGMVENDKEALLRHAIKKTDFNYVNDEDYDIYINRLYSLGQRGWVPGPADMQLKELLPNNYYEILVEEGVDVDDWVSPEAYDGDFEEKIVEDSEVIKEEEEYLEPKFDNAQSFYKKAVIDNGKLYSYGKLVAEFIDGEPLIHDWFSNTTGRHIKEFLKQGGHRADSKKQMMQDYGRKVELEEANEEANDALLQKFLKAKDSSEMTKLLLNTNMSQSLLRKLQNIAEMYRENLDNEEDDVFKGTEDSYAREGLDNGLMYLIDTPELEEYMKASGLYPTDPATKERVVDRLLFTFSFIIENEIQGNYTLAYIFEA